MCSVPLAPLFNIAHLPDGRSSAAVGALDEGHGGCQIGGHQQVSLGGVKVEPRESRMKKPFVNPAEQRCLACDGTGFPTVKQPAQPGRRVYPPPCKACDGKGRTSKTAK
jgi:hypothetical protein